MTRRRKGLTLPRYHCPGRGPLVVAVFRYAFLRGVLVDVCTTILEAYMRGTCRRYHSPEEIEALTQAAIDNKLYRQRIAERRTA